MPRTKRGCPKRKTSAKWIRSDADERAMREGCYFDERAGRFVVEFFETFLRHTLGQWAGQPFTLLPWQRDDVVLPLFGWKRQDGTRRFRKAYIEVPKKNGKSTLCGGLALYLLIADGEPRAQIFGAAADRDQAGIVFSEAANMVNASHELSRRVEVIRSTKRIIDPRTNSFYHAISADAYTNEGLNAQAIIFDELHAQKTRDLWDALRYAMASRRQPLLISITTAGVNRESICYEQHDYAQHVLNGNTKDSSFFGYIRAAETEADWTDPAIWRQANPSFGTTLREDQFAEDCREARESPRKEAPSAATGSINGSTTPTAGWVRWSGTKAQNPLIRRCSMAKPAMSASIWPASGISRPSCSSSRSTRSFTCFPGFTFRRTR